jgi:hypothetical protein
VPAGQLLEYRMGDGREPLFKFLNKPVSDMEVPCSNDAKKLKKMMREIFAAYLVEGGELY